MCSPFFMRIFINVRNYIRKIIKESLKPLPKVGDFLYCHTEGVGPKVGDYVKVTYYEHRAGNRGEDIISIDAISGARFTVQKDVAGRNYEDWFTLIPPDIENIDFFGQLYESEDELNWVKDLDSTNLLKVGQKFLVPSPAKSSGSSPVLAVITKVTDRVVYILPANLPASYPSKGTPFDIGKLLKILNSGAWTVVENNLNESREGKGYIVLTFNPPIETKEDYEYVTSSLLAIYPNLHWLNGTSIKDAPTTIIRKGGVHYFVFNKSTNTVYYGLSPHEYDLSTNHDIIDGRDLINQNFNIDDVFTKLYESEDDFGWVKDIPFPHGYAIDLCNIEGDRAVILNQVFDKLEIDGYTKDRLDYYRKYTSKPNSDIILYLGSNYSGDGKKGLEYDYCHVKKRFVKGIYDKEAEGSLRPLIIPQYKLISYQDFLGI